ncbi:MAG TPA: hypothetical protein DDY31_19215, partial [Lachnospiraceae bacterium]|nr:hypothetical protein [Lachnospiraceae bacterium]
MVMEQKINPLQTNQGRHSQGSRQGAVQQRAANSRNASGQAARTIGSSTANYGVARNAASLHLGDVLRGEITDLRNNEISITLEDNTVVRAQIPDSASYSIGQTGTFRLTNIAGNTIYLENISTGYTDTEIALINKALEEANLPVTERNQTTVKALMDNLLPINRESIQSLMQQSYDLKTEDMNTIAVMKRLMMEMNADSVEQFSNYRNDNYQLLERLQDFSQSIPSLLHTLASDGPADAVAAFGKSLLSIGLSSPETTAAPQTIADLPQQVQEDIFKMLSETPMTEDALKQLREGTLSLQDALTMIRDAAMSGTLSSPDGDNIAALTEQLNQINQALEPAAQNPPVLTEDFVKNIITLNQAEEVEIKEPSPETIEEAPEEAATKPESRFAFAGKFLHSISENAKNTLSGTLDALRNAAAPQTTSQTAPNTSLSVLADAYQNYAREHDLLSSFLSANER